MPGKSSRKPASARKATPKSGRGNAGRILTTHVGSLIRPSKLQEFLKAQRDREPYDQAAFDACLHDPVADVVHKQAEIGLDVINDGEYGKTISWSRYVLERMSGFEQRDQPRGARARHRQFQGCGEGRKDRRASPPTAPTNTTRATRNTSSPSPMRCTRNTRRSSMPA
jgi:methionine synthase II (cobalamin-independent)